MRWFTCTPVDFGGGEDFFSRDSGLLSRGFRRRGVDSLAVMPGEARPGDCADLLRTAYANLESAAWWRSHQLDGVVLYAWGRPRYRKVAKAIHQAGIDLVLNQDSQGWVSPRCGLRDWVTAQEIIHGVGRLPGALAGFSVSLLRDFTIGLLVSDALRARHLRHGNWITAVSPLAAQRYQKLCRRYVKHGTTQRVAFIPHPVNPLFDGGCEYRDRRVVVVGRWDDERQKRSTLMMQTMQQVLAMDQEVLLSIIGTRCRDLEAWHETLNEQQRARTTLHGRLLPAEIAAILRTARVSYCSSAFESFHIASAEALCSGCSIVSSRSICLPSFDWFLSEGDGSFADSDDAAGHASAIQMELHAWDHGERQPTEISRRWCDRLHAHQVAESLLTLCGQQVAAKGGVSDV